MLGKQRLSFNQAVEVIEDDDSISVQYSERIVGCCSKPCAEHTRHSLIREFAVKEVPDPKVVACAVCQSPIFRRQRHNAFTWNFEEEVSEFVLQSLAEGILAVFCDKIECREVAVAAVKRLQAQYCAWWDTNNRFLFTAVEPGRPEVRIGTPNRIDD